MKKILTAFLFSLFVVSARAEDYTSVYQIPLQTPYCSTVAEGGALGGYPCAGNYYFHWATLTGFHDQWNPNSSIRRCQQAPGTTCGNISTNISYGLNITALIGNLFRYYIPPGTVAANLILYGMPSAGSCAVISRFGAPPTANFPTSFDPFESPTDYPALFSTSQYPSILSLWNGKTVAQLKQSDWFATNQGGHITILNDAEEPLQEGGWLYIKFRSYDGSQATVQSFAWTANAAIYTDWFNSFSGSWLSNGDPPAGTPQPTPTPSPTATGILVASFDSGLYVYSPAGWFQLTTSVPDDFLYIAGTVYADFGALGFWMWHDSWVQMSTLDAVGMELISGALYVNFGTGGIWKWDGTSFIEITGSRAFKVEGAR